MSKERENAERIQRILPDVFEGLLSGMSFAKLACEYKTSKVMLMSVIYDYKPYKEWVRYRKRNPKSMEKDLKKRLDAGATVSYLAELYNMDYGEMRCKVRDIEIGTNQSYLDSSDREAMQSVFTIADVNEFKIKVQVGELLIYDQTEDGIVMYCKILKKHLWYADTDMGSIDWNWLCVNNERRLRNDEILYGE